MNWRVLPLEVYVSGATDVSGIGMHVCTWKNKLSINVKVANVTYLHSPGACAGAAWEHIVTGCVR